MRCSHKLLQIHFKQDEQILHTLTPLGAAASEPKPAGRGRSQKASAPSQNTSILQGELTQAGLSSFFLILRLFLFLLLSEDNGLKPMKGFRSHLQSLKIWDQENAK